MPSDLRDLYQELILDHSRRPRNFGRLEKASHQAVGHNPLCGDSVTVFVELEGGVVRNIRFQGSGCAISTASASMMTEILKGKTEGEAESLFGRFRDLVTGQSASAGAGLELAKLKVFSQVHEYPVRVKCAILAWHTFRAALKHQAETVSTE